MTKKKRGIYYMFVVKNYTRSYIIIRIFREIVRKLDGKKPGNRKLQLSTTARNN